MKTKRSLRERLLIHLSKYKKEPIILNRGVFTAGDEVIDAKMIEHFKAVMGKQTARAKSSLEEVVKAPDYASLSGVEFRYRSFRFVRGRAVHELELYPSGERVMLEDTLFKLLMRKKNT